MATCCCRETGPDTGNHFGTAWRHPTQACVRSNHGEGFGLTLACCCKKHTQRCRWKPSKRPAWGPTKSHKASGGLSETPKGSKRRQEASDETRSTRRPQSTRWKPQEETRTRRLSHKPTAQAAHGCHAARRRRRRQLKENLGISESRHRQPSRGPKTAPLAREAPHAFKQNKEDLGISETTPAASWRPPRVLSRNSFSCVGA